MAPLAEGSRGETAAERVERLRELVRYHQYRYYVLDNPELTDQEFDALFHELRELEEAHPRAAHAG